MKKKVFISGEATRSNIVSVFIRLLSAQEILKSLGYEPSYNPEAYKVDLSTSFKEKVSLSLKKIDLSDAIYLMEGWTNSNLAMIEYNYAVETGKEVIFGSSFLGTQMELQRIKNAIQEVTKFSFDSLLKDDKNRSKVLARAIFVHHYNQFEPDHGVIAKYIQRHRTSIYYLLNKYNESIRFDPLFREMAGKVDHILQGGEVD